MSNIAVGAITAGAITDRAITAGAITDRAIMDGAMVTPTLTLMGAIILMPILMGAIILTLVLKDNDGTVDLTEVKDAASTLFDKLDADSDATLDRKEIRGHAGKKELKEADPDKDGTCMGAPLSRNFSIIS